MLATRYTARRHFNAELQHYRLIMKIIFILSILFSVTNTAYGDLPDKEVMLGLIVAAKERTLHEVRYDGSYITISYPDGDVPSNIGVCTDVVIRSY